LDEDGDGKVSASEFAAYYRNFGGQAFQVFLTPPRQPFTASLNRSLFSRLDTNRDGVLSKAELAAAEALLRLDENDDDILSPRELDPRLQNDFNEFQLELTRGGVQAPRRPTDSFILYPEESGEKLAATLLKRYGPVGAKALERREIRLDPAVF